MAKEYQISLIWSTDDFQDIAPDSTLLQRRAALAIVKRGHEADVGVSWENLESAMDMVLEATPKEVRSWANDSDVSEVKR